MTKYKSYLKSFIPFFILLGTIVVCRAYNKDVTNQHASGQDTVQIDKSSQTIQFSEGLVKSEISHETSGSEGNSDNIFAGIYPDKKVGVNAHWMIPASGREIIKPGINSVLHYYNEINPN